MLTFVHLAHLSLLAKQHISRRLRLQPAVHHGRCCCRRAAAPCHPACLPRRPQFARAARAPQWLPVAVVFVVAEQHVVAVAVVVVVVSLTVHPVVVPTQLVQLMIERIIQVVEHPG